MDITTQKQLTNKDRIFINQQVKTDLLDHLYRGCLPGTICGMLASIAIFLDYYNNTPFELLVAWMIFYNIMMLSLTGLYFIYQKFKERCTLQTWEIAYSLMMIGCAISWTPGIYLLPEDVTRQFIALLAIFLASAGYATGTIGQFALCVATMNIMLVPLMVWCFLKGGILYNIIGVYTILYMAFMFGTNHRSTQWFKDSLKLKLENTLVSYQATHDLLTDLPNLRMLPQFIEASIRSVRANNTEFALVCFSLNRMEVINDSLGHESGNSIIQAVTARLNTLVANTQEMQDETQFIITISRTDAFNILCTPVKEEDVEDRVNLLFTILNEPIFLEQTEVKMTASAGISIFPRDGDDPQSLLANADAAMLQAKQFGGNHFEFYRKEINAQIPQRIQMENDLHDVLKNNELLVYYQPLVDIRSGKISGAEALLRWPHPVHGFISPMKFIPLAEETGLIVPIGEWVMQEACRQTRIWHQMGFSNFKIAVNLSEKQLRHKTIVSTIKRVLKATEFDARYLELELTETAMLDETIVHVVQEFKKLGLSLAVDDFGTGYSGLSYLKRFEIDKLKIDQSFVRDIPANEDSITIVSAILAMARELGISSLAEGVETEEQLNFLIAKKCDYIQGYYFSKPLDSKAFTQLLITHPDLQIYDVNTEKTTF